MNLMSSIAKTFVGSPIAIVRVAPVLFTGRTPYLRATSPGTILMMFGSISKWDRSIEGTPNCWERVSVMSASVHGADPHEGLAELAPLLALGLQCGVELILRDQLRLEKKVAKFYGHGLTADRKAWAEEG